jgi:hypothetical protein
MYKICVVAGEHRNKTSALSPYKQETKNGKSSRTVAPDKEERATEAQNENSPNTDSTDERPRKRERQYRPEITEKVFLFSSKPIPAQRGWG